MLKKTSIDSRITLNVVLRHIFNNLPLPPHQVDGELDAIAQGIRTPEQRYAIGWILKSAELRTFNTLPALEAALDNASAGRITAQKALWDNRAVEKRYLINAVFALTPTIIDFMDHAEQLLLDDPTISRKVIERLARSIYGDEQLEYYKALRTIEEQVREPEAAGPDFQIKPASKEALSRSNMTLVYGESPSTEHPNYSADRYVATIRNRSAIVAALDGVGSGGEISGQAAQLVKIALETLEIDQIDTYEKAASLVRATIFGCARQIKNLQRASGNAQIDTTISGVLIFTDSIGARHGCGFNVGDSRTSFYIPDFNVTDRVTTDHSFFEALVQAGQLTGEDKPSLIQQGDVRAFGIYRTVGNLNTPDGIDLYPYMVFKDPNTQENARLKPGDTVIVYSDGIHDNIPEDELHKMITDEMSRPSPNIARLRDRILNRAKRNIIKPDDMVLVILRL